ncbi:DUF262 domain-containing protein [Geobacter benzoatilyticus]|uniref:DUF262 domain-containing protein n=1 Tax=Geobacter benzoatilyticus TaxID=2815309 RepID=A0ABX7Q3I9_9BACT|nr:DUF262 domain-containing protein [Geobacter benzoatilyticus]QSV45466.1 DUF262 domain-containing protein [Geobacter benzoatilyticus]
MREEATSSFLHLLSVTDVAGWQIPSLLQKSKGVTAKLPALQRSAVWKPRQVEMLWDSLLNGFPVGSFLLTPFRKDLKTQNFLYEIAGLEAGNEAEYHLLDGQQRCNAISLAFINSWDTKITCSAALWIDLDTDDIADERRFVFRVVTRSHPWGYQRSDPSKTLEYQKRRKALSSYYQAYKWSHDDQEVVDGLFGTSTLIRHAWPWDARCPVPVPFLIDAVTQSPHSVWGILDKLMEERLPYWRALDSGDFQDICWKRRWSTLRDNPTAMMDGLCEGLHRLVRTDRSPSLLIPALILPRLITGAPSQEEDLAQSAGPTLDSIRQDPVETLFIRVNSAGTPLQGEELNYSILKSIWPGAQDVVETLSTGIMAPSRLVALISRLVVAKSSSDDKRPPAALDVTRFRRLVHGRDPQCRSFLASIQDYLSHGKGLFDLARKLLNLQCGDAHTYRLPPVVAADIARKSPEIFFIFLFWLDRLKDAGIDPTTFDQRVHRRLVGALTALSWFKEDEVLCGVLLWTRLQGLSGDNLQEMFSVGGLKSCISVGESGKLPLIPLLPPDLLKEAVELSLRGLRNGTNQRWQTWRWWDNFTESLPKSERVRSWYTRKVKEHDDEVDYRREAWPKFADRLWGMKEMVLYAQREWLVRWFSDFDPASPDQLEDTDRPWDFDHIHPQKYIYGKWNMPQILKDWHGSIGNLRAWPFELNRSDGETTPCSKLKDAGEESSRFFPTTTSCKKGPYKEVILASSIPLRDWSHWEASTPLTDPFPANYLAKPEDFGQCRVSLLNAITRRWIYLYKQWYDNLLIKDLFV